MKYESNIHSAQFNIQKSPMDSTTTVSAVKEESIF